MVENRKISKSKNHLSRVKFVRKTDFSRFQGVKTTSRPRKSTFFTLTHHFALPEVLQGGKLRGAWAVTPLVALKRAVGVRNWEVFTGCKGRDQRLETRS